MKRVDFDLGLGLRGEVGDGEVAYAFGRKNFAHFFFHRKEWSAPLPLPPPQLTPHFRCTVLRARAQADCYTTPPLEVTMMGWRRQQGHRHAKAVRQQPVTKATSALQHIWVKKKLTQTACATCHSFYMMPAFAAGCRVPTEQGAAHASQVMRPGC